MKKAALFFALLCLATQVSASYISLKTTVAAKVDVNTLKVFVSVVNKGDEAAYNVQAEIRVVDRKILADKTQELGVNQGYKAYYSFPLQLKQPGQYPLVVIMHYADANQYPFSALTAQTFNSRAQDVPAEAFGKMQAEPFWKKGKIYLSLKNLGSEDLAVTTHLVVPGELSAGESAVRLDLKKKSTSETGFSLENFSALAGSTYQIFAVSEFTKDNLHYTVITPGTVRIVEIKTILGLEYRYILLILALLIFLFVVYQLGFSFLKK
ncbi:hypothetical protein A3H38_00225 [candidate division WOR-1 bacterium RIFCSPLOWO2_02_FULL_46_20]|uniref:CARDB domain-containing protein n=2 Tax=Saganbacteria TaxID=1703751 RepID=A0A1F4R4V2_UNCSA|nr:MAG: hypothetical protein A3J44_06645 [candidate division WOR-1 bacterium RIFCSPHIGHO2_02_FULL_45_12]OGC03184.1 MAG: hypothetical protein A3H38_00225 [candidate division WOR-1 bacterium RIFCSPLOWO2_02_FULL_46_20]OGC09826.1 MAG: hypothetical protein A3F86_03990 [candidate division WOR-1 bacterium RIFCSPLOWO2_12_FULL_45_9]